VGGNAREEVRMPMYNAFYQFTKEPFNITPDPAFLYLSPTHQEALATIIYGIENRKAFVLITGEVGTGKTSILRAFLQDIKRDNIRYIYIINPNITFREFLEKIFRELEQETEGLTTAQMVEKLHRVLVDEYLHGRNFVVVIDEAQNMPIETMESMRLLSNLETSTYKLIQIVFAAPSEFEQTLDRPRLKSLKQRIAVRARIQALSAEESAEYIQHRLSVVSTDGEPAFTKGAIKMIAAKAQGIPRVINVLCDNALIAGLGYHEKPVDAKIVREVIADYNPTAKSKDKGNSPRWGPMAAGFIFLLIIGLFFTLYRVFDILDQQKTQLAKLRQPIVRGKIDASLREQALLKVQPTDAETAGKSPSAPEERAAVPDPFGAPAAADKAVRTREAGGAGKAANIPKSGKQFPMKAVVKKDDTFFRMTVRAYGFSNDRVMEYVKQNNPSIRDARRIEVGTTIVFPPLNDSLKESRER
jgi:general secretion pathway protein A